MKPKSLPAFLSGLLILWLSSAYVFAFELKVVDQNGEPVNNAFVALPEGSIAQPNPEPAIMDQVQVKFVPHVLAIEVGQAVIFPNSDNIRHHVYSFSEPKQFEIKLYQGVPKTPLAFTQPGLVALGCNIHDSMLGYIYVSPWPEFQVTGESGMARLSKPTNTVAVWHPWIKGLTEPLMIDLTPQLEQNLVTITLNLDKPKTPKAFKSFKRRYDD